MRNSKNDEASLPGYGDHCVKHEDGYKTLPNFCCPPRLCINFARSTWRPKQHKRRRMKTTASLVSSRRPNDSCTTSPILAPGSRVSSRETAHRPSACCIDVHSRTTT